MNRSSARGVCLLLAAWTGAAVAQVPTPEQGGIRLPRPGEKQLETLAPKAGGPTERIEIQSTDDHIDYVVKVYTLQRANASEVYQLVKNAVELEGGFVDRIATGSDVSIREEAGVFYKYSGRSHLIVTAPEWMIPYLDDAIQALDQPGLLKVATGTGYLYVSPKHRRPTELAALIAASAASGEEILTADDSRNLLYLEDTPSFMESVLEALETFDRPPDQIQVHVRIYEIDESDARDVGLDWYSWKKSIASGGLDVRFGEAEQENLDLESITSAWSFNALLATEFLNYLADNGRAKVVTDTRVTVINGATATVDAVRQIPDVLRGFVGNDVVDSPLRDSPEALDADRLIKEFIEGITLQIVPTIARDTVQLDVTAMVASHVGYTPLQSVPIIASSTVQSSVDLADAKAAVLGGLTRVSSVDERAGIPWLKDLPGVRYLFSREVKREHQSQIVISLVPTWVRHSEDALDLESDEMAPRITYKQSPAEQK